MLSPSSDALRRLLAVLVGLVLIVLSGLPRSAYAHEGHDDKPVAIATAATPRIALHSETYELVGILKADRLALYLDGFGSNEPVTDARIAMTLGGEELTAEAAPDGTYAVRSAKLAGEGPLELVFTVTGPTGDDLLIGTLQRPSGPPAGATTGATHNLQGSRTRPDPLGAEAGRAALVGGVALGLGILLGLAVRSRRKLLPLGGVALAAILLSTVFALSHDGEDHGGGAKAAPPATDAPQRLPDGGAFVPKPSQRFLEVRTAMVKPETAQRATTLIGRVIADPNRSGLVQSINGGRVSAPEGGFAQLGQAVKKGAVLALIEAPIISADRASLAEKIGDIEQQTALAEARLARARRLAESGAGTRTSVSDAELEVEGLKRRRDAVRDVRSAPEILRAPIDGVIASIRVVAGQVVQGQDVLFQIVDPGSLWIEAVVFHDSDLPALGAATALATDGARMKLAFRGTGRALQQQANSVQFAVLDPPGSLSVGQPVTVIAPSGAAETGIILPREAVVRGPNGETLVWRHTDPERFEPRPVRIEAFDAGRVVVRAGLTPGDRVVTRGAELVNQIR